MLMAQMMPHIPVTRKHRRARPEDRCLLPHGAVTLSRVNSRVLLPMGTLKTCCSGVPACVTAIRVTERQVVCHFPFSMARVVESPSSSIVDAFVPMLCV